MIRPEDVCQHRGHREVRVLLDTFRRRNDERPRLKAYRQRLLAHPIVARAVDEGRPYRHYFPLGAPDRD